MLYPLDLNLASRPFRNDTLLWLAHALAVGLLVAFSVWNVTTHARHRRELSELKTNVASIQSRNQDLDRRDLAAQRGITRFDVEDLSRQAAKANDVLQRKALSWTRLFNEMEEILPYEVRMISVRPIFHFGRQTASARESLPEGSVPVSVQGAAKSLEALLEFEGALLEDPRFDNVDPHRQSREGSEIFFDLRFLYFPNQGDLKAQEEEKAGEAPAPAEGEDNSPESAVATAEAGNEPEMEREDRT